MPTPEDPLNAPFNGSTERALKGEHGIWTAAKGQPSSIQRLNRESTESFLKGTGLLAPPSSIQRLNRESTERVVRHRFRRHCHRAPFNGSTERALKGYSTPRYSILSPAAPFNGSTERALKVEDARDRIVADLRSIQRLNRESTERKKPGTAPVAGRKSSIQRLNRESTERVVLQVMRLIDDHAPFNGSTERALKARPGNGLQFQYVAPFNGSTERALKAGIRHKQPIDKLPGSIQRLNRESTESCCPSACPRTSASSIQRLNRESTESLFQAVGVLCERYSSIQRLNRESTESGDKPALPAGRTGLHSTAQQREH